MANPDFGLAPEDLTAHQQHLGGVSDSLSAVSNTAGGLGAPPMAFGLIGSFIPALLQPMIMDASEVIKAAAESVNETSSMVGSASTSYANMESAGSDGFAALDGDL